MQELLAGAAIGSIITLLIMVVWHRSMVADLLSEIVALKKNQSEYRRLLGRIKKQFKDGKSGTAKLAVKIARGEGV